MLKSQSIVAIVQLACRSMVRLPIVPKCGFFACNLLTHVGWDSREDQGGLQELYVGTIGRLGLDLASRRGRMVEAVLAPTRGWPPWCERTTRVSGGRVPRPRLLSAAVRIVRLPCSDFWSMREIAGLRMQQRLVKSRLDDLGMDGCKAKMQRGPLLPGLRFPERSVSRFWIELWIKSQNG
jgi:hypothetical protein